MKITNCMMEEEQVRRIQAAHYDKFKQATKKGYIQFFSTEGELFVDGSSNNMFLMAHSYMFDTMFTSGLKEDINRKAIILDIKFEALQSIVSFTQTGAFDSNDVSLILQILIAADRYTVDLLENDVSNRSSST